MNKRDECCPRVYLSFENKTKTRVANYFVQKRERYAEKTSRNRRSNVTRSRTAARNYVEQLSETLIGPLPASRVTSCRTFGWSPRAVDVHRCRRFYRKYSSRGKTVFTVITYGRTNDIVRSFDEITPNYVGSLLAYENSYRAPPRCARL